jgi:hypothetical protein
MHIFKPYSPDIIQQHVPKLPPSPLPPFHPGEEKGGEMLNFSPVEYVKRAGNWNVVGEGIFARRPEDMVPENPEGGIEGNARLSVNQPANAH